MNERLLVKGGIFRMSVDLTFFVFFNKGKPFGLVTANARALWPMGHFRLASSPALNSC